MLVARKCHPSLRNKESTTLRLHPSSCRLQRFASVQPVAEGEQKEKGRRDDRRPLVCVAREAEVIPPPAPPCPEWRAVRPRRRASAPLRGSARRASAQPGGGSS